MKYISIPMPGLPIQISCYADGHVAFAPMYAAPVVIDQPQQGVQAIIGPHDMAIGANTVIDYGVRYNPESEPELKAWIQSQNLDMPKFR